MSNPSAAPVEFKINDVVYYMNPLTDQNIEELNNHIKQQILATARTFCAGETNELIVKATMSDAMTKATKVDWLMNPELITESLDTLIYLIWLGMRDASRISRSHLKLEILKDLDANYGNAMEAFAVVNPFYRKQTKPIPLEDQPQT